jgi:hypothetical protein
MSMSSLEDRSLSVFALAVVAVLGWRVIGATPRHIEPVAPPRPAAFTALSLETRVARLADAIALAEGYYAGGRHDGRALPHLLNNPGMLKRSALADRDVPTWRATGFLIFPTADVGWAALRYQVCAMLLGASRVYEPSDTLAAAGRKYAEGDANWGHTVARALGVSPALRLGDLAADLPAPPLPGSIQCRRLAGDGGRGRHADADAVN